MQCAKRELACCQAKATRTKSPDKPLSIHSASEVEHLQQMLNELT